MDKEVLVQYEPEPGEGRVYIEARLCSFPAARSFARTAAALCCEPRGRQ